LSTIGIGAATIDTRLEKDEFAPGEEVRGTIEIKGGNLVQDVDGIYVHVFARYDSTAGSSKAVGTVEKFPVAPGRTIASGSREEVSFSFRLPYETPPSMGSSEVWLRTGLDVKSAFDPQDEDRITVRPTPEMQAVLDALERLDFELREAATESLPDRVRRSLHFGLELEFVPRRGEFVGRLDELEMFMFPSEGSVDLVMQVDRRGFGGESYAELTVSDSDASQGPDHVADTLAQAIRQHI
jgi:sporulation-control protein